MRVKTFWFIEVLRICVSAMEGILELFYSPKFYVHFPKIVVGEPIVMIYHLYMPFAHMCVFCYFFHTVQSFPQEIDCHLVAPDTETELRFQGFGILYSTPLFDGFLTLPAFLLDIEDLEESSNEESKDVRG